MDQFFENLLSHLPNFLVQVCRHHYVCMCMLTVLQNSTHYSNRQVVFIVHPFVKKCTTVEKVCLLSFRISRGDGLPSVKTSRFERFFFERVRAGIVSFKIAMKSLIMCLRCISCAFRSAHGPEFRAFTILAVSDNVPPFRYVKAELHQLTNTFHRLLTLTRTVL